MHRLIKAASIPRVLWVLFALIVCLWYLAPSSSGHSKGLSRGQKKEPQRLDIVLAYSGESPEQVRSSLKIVTKIPFIVRLKPRVIIYTKGLPTTTNRETLKKLLGADLLYELPDVGRDAESHLTHIIEHYDEIADHTLFLRGTIDFIDLVEPLLRTHFKPTLGVMGLGTYTTCPCDDCIAQINGNPDPIHGYKRIPQLYSIFNDRFCPPSGLLLSFKNQFIVSRARIIRNPKSKYVWLKSVYNDMSHFVHDDSLAKRPDDPLLAHTLERSWMAIFGCSDVRIAEECNRSDSASRCACYDDEAESV
jgi:Protein of unknown function (DUF3431)